MRPLLLLTRPEPQARRFAERIGGDIDLLIAPLSEVAPVAFDPAVFTDAAGLILTSVNAVPPLTGLPLRGLPAWCVGPATAKAAARAGYVVHEGGGDAETLIARLVRAKPEGPLVHAHGVHLARDLVAALAPHGIAVRGTVVYEARPLAWPPEVLDRMKTAPCVVAPLFSPRAADRFAQHLGATRPQGLRLVAISDNCAARLPEDLRHGTIIALTPDSDGMVRAILLAMSQERHDTLRRDPTGDK
ncbi:MAG: uroporphyrinogen-III synthase [Rhodobacteraceae bacterium]|jgi:uroporphyrinogen-III synthase|nr:uroporphyrinogen-III synthase [Paracoccaceae bacterium]